eukprot:389176_1
MAQCSNEEYEYAFSSFGIATTDENIPWAYIGWAISCVVCIPISCVFSRLLGKMSGNYCCVPMVSKEFELKEEEHQAAVNFTGFAVKIKAVIKASEISGIFILIASSWIMMNQYGPCPEKESVATTMAFAWIASLTAYILLWKIDVSLGVTKLTIWQKLGWVFSEKIITLICGSSFIRFIYVQQISPDVCCYVYNDELYLVSVYTILYLATFAIIWIGKKFRLHVLLMFVFTACCLCKSDNCCCEVKTKAPAGRLGKMLQPCLKCCVGVVGPAIPFVVMFVISPVICLGIRFNLLADKWQNQINGILDISDVVFIWIIVTAFTFFAVVAVERCRNKCCPAKEKEAEVELEAAIGKEDEDKAKEEAKSSADKEETGKDDVTIEVDEAGKYVDK